MDTGEFKYQKHWSHEYKNEADVDFLVEGVVFPVHSSVVGQSEVLRSALRDTQNEGRIQLSSPFESTKVAVMDDFLSLVYVSSGTTFPDDLARSREVIELAMLLGLDQVAQIGVNNLGKQENLKSFQKELLKKRDDSDFICWWLRTVQLAPGSAAHLEMATFLVKTCHVFSDSSGVPLLKQTIKPLLSQEMMFDMVRSLKNNVFSLQLRKSKTIRDRYSPLANRIPLKLIDQGEVTIYEFEAECTKEGCQGSAGFFRISLKKE